VAKKSKGATPPRKIEYIRVPKHWFSDVLEHSMTTVIRPPTARTRRKELKIEVKIPEEIFLDLVRPLTTDCVAGFQWTDDKKAALKPTKTAKTYTMYRYDVTKPPYRVTCVVTKLVTEPTASNEQVMEQVMHYLLFGGKSK
jgi:hypothetical protein